MYLKESAVEIQEVKFGYNDAILDYYGVLKILMISWVAHWVVRPMSPFCDVFRIKKKKIAMWTYETDIQNLY